MHLRTVVQCMLLLGATVGMSSIATSVVPNQLIPAAVPNPLGRFRRNTNGTSPETRVVGGEPVRPGELNYVCGVVHSSNSRIYCGCSIITQQHALTVAGCADLLPAADGVEIAAGSIEVDDGLLFSVDKIIVHPKYNEKTSDYDVAVLHTTVPIVGPNIGTITLALPNQFLRDGIDYLVVGWGAVVPEGPYNPVLLKANVNKSPDLVCAADYADSGQIITPRMVCAAAPGRDACEVIKSFPTLRTTGSSLQEFSVAWERLLNETGDGGGPLVYQHHINGLDSPSFLDVQVGITSFGEACADPKHPGVYTRITNPEIIEFIYENAVL